MTQKIFLIAPKTFLNVAKILPPVGTPVHERNRKKETYFEREKKRNGTGGIKIKMLRRHDKK